MTVIWVLNVNGYLGVDGKTFATLEQCRNYAHDRIINLGQQNSDIVWQCVQREDKASSPVEAPPKYLKSP